MTDLAKQMRDDTQTIFDLRMEVFRGEQRAERLRGFIEEALEDLGFPGDIPHCDYRCGHAMCAAAKRLRAALNE